MKRIALIIFSFLIIISTSKAQIINKEPLSPRITGYKIDAKLDPVSKTVHGTMNAFWVNISGNNISDARLHMYMNAFSSSKTTFFKELDSAPGTRESDYGWIKISSMTDRNGTDLTRDMQFISPDDGNPDDNTVLKVNLAGILKPVDTLFLNVEFETKLPDFSGKNSQATKRSGFKNDFFFVGQWFPKFGVYETPGIRYSVTGGWNCHQFHAESEFYADHSVYDVKITVPKEYVVGSGGMLLNESVENDLKTLTYRAEDIVDFAWTAWPGYTEFTDQWNHVKITFLVPKDRVEQVPRQFAAVKNALEYLTENVGPYPWPHLTFIDPPAGTGHCGGMEYTTLFTSWSSYYVPEWRHLPEMVTVHEFGHAYFMGILATNEFEDPWMDEGINTFWEARIMDHCWGEKSGMLDHPFFKVADKTSARSSYIHSPYRQVISNKEYSWNYPFGTYDMMSYMKASTWLYTMMGIIGEGTTNEVFREYYKKWAFKHPAPKDFIDVVSEVVRKNYGDKFGPDMNWFFDQTLYGTGICDYKVAGFRFYRQDTAEVKADTTDALSIAKPVADSLYKCVVELLRLGEVMLPEEVLVHFTNGHEALMSWDGKERYKNLEFMSNSGIQWVKLDPEYKIRMDVNFINNSKTYRTDKVPVRRFTNKFISFLQFFISTITL
jgi:hypothetical protein